MIPGGDQTGQPGGGLGGLGGGDLSQLLQQAQQMQQRLLDAQEELARAEVSGSAGGGLVRATVTGGGEVVGPQIDPTAIDPSDPEGLADLENVVIVPHIASATQWTRQGMAILAASNVAGLLSGYPVWNRPDILSFLGSDPPAAAPSVLNAEELGLALF